MALTGARSDLAGEGPERGDIGVGYAGDGYLTDSTDMRITLKSNTVPML